MAFDFMMASGFTGPPFNEFVSGDTSLTQDPNEYDSFMSGGE